MKYTGHISKVIHGYIDVEADTPEEAIELVRKAEHEQEQYISDDITWDGSEVMSVTVEEDKE